MIYKATQSVANGLDTLRRMLFFILIQFNSLLFPPVWAPEFHSSLLFIILPAVLPFFLEVCLHHGILISVFYSTMSVLFATPTYLFYL